MYFISLMVVRDIYVEQSGINLLCLLMRFYYFYIFMKTYTERIFENLYRSLVNL